MILDSDPGRAAGGDALGLAVLLVAALLAASTALPWMGERAPAFPHPSIVQAGARPGAPSAASRPPLSGRLDINTATAEALQGLPGIGPAMAARIVAGRKARGPFRSSEDLLRVPGIGPKRWERIRPLVRLTEGP